jgi:molecular chaperone GrpE
MMMVDHQILFEQFLHQVQTPPPPPEYLGNPPEKLESFDPYQFVSEWIALRQEMKQQGKLFQAAQTQLQQELAAVQSQNQQLQKSATKDQEQVLKGLLDIMDALDRACEHWNTQELTLSKTVTLGFRGKLAQWLEQMSQKLAPTDATEDTLLELIKSDRQGVDLIRRNLLDLLGQQQVTPIVAQGQTLDSQCMYAVGQQPSSVPANIVIQEVVRGYRWQGRVLREAQVIVSSGKSE